ncbi:MAG TPA: hypothetical protein VLV86_18830 [Vicinamibacterales bacterium]|nr:hypothetical protein [Vicinamibacterales bacterium]
MPALVFSIPPVSDLARRGTYWRIGQTKRNTTSVPLRPLLLLAVAGSGEPRFAALVLACGPRGGFFWRRLKPLMTRISKWIGVHDRTSSSRGRCRATIIRSVQATRCAFSADPRQLLAGEQVLETEFEQNVESRVRHLRLWNLNDIDSFNAQPNDGQVLIGIAGEKHTRTEHVLPFVIPDDLVALRHNKLGEPANVRLFVIVTADVKDLSDSSVFPCADRNR